MNGQIRETTSFLGRVCYRLARIYQHRMADIDRRGRGLLASGMMLAA